MKVFALGGAGRTGRQTTRILEASGLVTEIMIASRQKEVAERAATELGKKATAVQVDIADEERLTSLMTTCDIVVNTSGPDFEVQLPSVRAAIRAATHYCDISFEGRPTQQVLALDAQAKVAGITALIGIGSAPGLNNLVAKHAQTQLDELEEIQTYVLVRPSTLAGWRNASMHSHLEAASGRIPTYRDGAWVDIDATENAVDLILPGSHVVRVYPCGTAEPVTLPRYLPGVRTVSSLYGYIPHRVSELFYEQVRRITAGECDVHHAFEAFYEDLARESPQKLTVAEELPFSGVIALGRNEDRRVRRTYTRATGGTGPTLEAATLKILRGEIDECGVIPPEACLDPLPFFDEVVHLWPKSQRPPEGKIMVESLE